MKIKTLVLIVLCVAVRAGNCQSFIKDSIHHFVSTKMTDYSGVILIGANQEIIYQYTSALRETNDFPAGINTTFKIGSITKPFTATAILILEHEGKLKTSDRIVSYINGLPNAWGEITIHELLTHTSGLMHSWELDNFENYFKGNKNWQIIDVIKLYYDRPVNSQKIFHYSGLGYFVLAQVIEVVSKRSYNEYLEDAIFKRLDMNSTFGYQANGQNPHLSVGYGADGVATDLTNSSFLYGGGNLVSTAIDLFKFDCSLYQNTILNKGSTEKIFNRFARTNNGRYYGYGWLITDEGGKTIMRHGGRVPGFRSYYVRIPESKLFFAFLTNNEVNHTKIQDELTFYVEALVKHR